MPQIVWCGNRSWNTDFPEKVLPENVEKLKRPDDIFKSSLPYGIIPLMISFVLVAI